MFCDLVYFLAGPALRSAVPARLVSDMRHGHLCCDLRHTDLIYCNCYLDSDPQRCYHNYSQLPDLPFSYCIRMFPDKLSPAGADQLPADTDSMVPIKLVSDAFFANRFFYLHAVTN